MPSDKKRILVYLTDEQFALVDRAATSTGESRSATIADLIQSAAPMLERVADLADAIRAAPDDVRATFAGAAVRLEEEYGGLLQQADEFWESLHSAARGEGGEGPRLVIRGPES